MTDDICQRDEDDFPLACERCGHSPILAARVSRDHRSKTTGEITATGGDIWTRCLHCDNPFTTPPDNSPDEGDADKYNQADTAPF